MDKMIISDIKSANMNYNNALKSKMNVANKKQTLLNILLSNVDDIIESCLNEDDLMKQLVSARKQVAELNNRISELEEKIADAEKPSSKEKTDKKKG